MELPKKPPGFAAFRSFFDGLSSDELLALGSRVDEVVSQQGWDDLMGLVDTYKDGLTVELVHGPIHSHEKYAALASQISGLETVRVVAESVRYAVAERQAKNERANAEREREEARR